PRMLNNGLHWASPVTTDTTGTDPYDTTKGVFKAGQGFAAALVIAQCGTASSCTIGGISGGSNPWQTICGWLQTSSGSGGPQRTPEITLRLFWPYSTSSNDLPGTGQELGQ